MAWGSLDSGAAPSLARLGRITSGNGHATSLLTSQVSLRSDCADSSSATNVRIWDSFKGGSTSMTPDNEQWDAEEVEGETETYTVTHSGTGTFFISRVLDTNNTGFGNMWLLDQLAGDDTIVLTNRAKATVDVHFDTINDDGGEQELDDWDIRQDTESSTVLEDFYGIQVVSSNSFTVSGEGDQ